MKASRGLIVRQEEGLSLCTRTPDESAAVLDLVSKALAEAGVAPPLRGELYGVRGLSSGLSVATIDRSTAIALGIRTRGIHLNAYRRASSGAIEMWLARRAQTRLHFPGRLDNLVAGGLPASLPPHEALQQEAYEEAGIEAALLKEVKPVGSLRYCMDTEAGLVDSEIDVFDLEVDSTFQPRNPDRTIEKFLIVSLEDAERLALEHDAFKFNCALVLFDFLIRHGFLDLDAETTRASTLLRNGRGALARMAPQGETP